MKKASLLDGKYFHKKSEIQENILERNNERKKRKRKMRGRENITHYKNVGMRNECILIIK